MNKYLLSLIGTTALALSSTVHASPEPKTFLEMVCSDNPDCINQLERNFDPNQDYVWLFTQKADHLLRTDDDKYIQTKNPTISQSLTYQQGEYKLFIYGDKDGTTFPVALNYEITPPQSNQDKIKEEFNFTLAHNSKNPEGHNVTQIMSYSSKIDTKNSQNQDTIDPVTFMTQSERQLQNQLSYVAFLIISNMDKAIKLDQAANHTIPPANY